MRRTDELTSRHLCAFEFTGIAEESPREDEERQMRQLPDDSPNAPARAERVCRQSGARGSGFRLSLGGWLAGRNYRTAVLHFRFVAVQSNQLQ
jgi:hypothetical protein